MQENNVILNLEHDLCLASGERNFIPPRAVAEFAMRCRWIERFMRRPEGDRRRIVPWGWDLQLRDRLLKEGVPAEELPGDGELEFIKENSRREVAQQLLMFLRRNGGVNEHIVSADYRIVAHSLQEVEEFLQERGRVVLKAPLSGSGKGVRFVTGEMMPTDRGWCRRTLELQGAVIVEERLDVVQEFAMLFEVGEVYAPDIKFMGYSMFYALNGVYKGNLLASNGDMEGKLAMAFGKVSSGKVSSGKGILGRIKEMTAAFLQERLCGRYSGFVGVDMFLFRDRQGKLLLNPTVEINLRMTMGMIARNIYDYYREEYGLGEGTHCFEPERGIFAV